MFRPFHPNCRWNAVSLFSRRALKLNHKIYKNILPFCQKQKFRERISKWNRPKIVLEFHQNESPCMSFRITINLLSSNLKVPAMQKGRNSKWKYQNTLRYFSKMLQEVSNTRSYVCVVKFKRSKIYSKDNCSFLEKINNQVTWYDIPAINILTSVLISG